MASQYLWLVSLVHSAAADDVICRSGQAPLQLMGDQALVQALQQALISPRHTRSLPGARFCVLHSLGSTAASLLSREAGAGAEAAKAFLVAVAEYQLLAV